MSGSDSYRDVLFGSSSMILDALAYKGSRRGLASTEASGSRFLLPNEKTVVEDERERILDVAEKILRHIGHRKMTLGDIADELRVSRANIYRFFPTRASVDECLFVRIADQTVKIAREIALEDETAAKRLTGIIEAVHRQTCDRIRGDRNVHALFAAAAMENWTVGRRYFEELTSIVEVIIRGGQEAGELKITDSFQAARAVFMGVISFLHPLLVEQAIADQTDIDAEMQNQISFLIQALSEPPREPRSLGRHFG